MSFINTGISSVTLFTPAAYVPSAAEPFMVCPWALARSVHFRVTESTMYSTPSLWVAGAFLKCVNIFWISTDSDYRTGVGEVLASGVNQAEAGMEDGDGFEGPTWMLETQRVVMVVTLLAEIPGGFSRSMAWR